MLASYLALFLASGYAIIIGQRILKGKQENTIAACMNQAAEDDIAQIYSCPSDDGSLNHAVCDGEPCMPLSQTSNIIWLTITDQRY